MKGMPGLQKTRTVKGFIWLALVQSWVRIHFKCLWLRITRNRNFPSCFLPWTTFFKQSPPCEDFLSDPKVWLQNRNQQLKEIFSATLFFFFFSIKALCIHELQCDDRSRISNNFSVPHTCHQSSSHDFIFFNSISSHNQVWNFHNKTPTSVEGAAVGLSAALLLHLGVFQVPAVAEVSLLHHPPDRHLHLQVLVDWPEASLLLVGVLKACLGVHLDEGG